MKYSQISLILFLLAFSTELIFSQTLIPEGTVSGNWSLLNSPYLINGNIEIPDDSTLIIDPGVVIEFQGHYGLNIQGVLIAEGNETDTITFTINDSTGFHDPNSILGGWKGIQIIDPDTTNDSTLISFCKFEFAKAVEDVWFLNSGGAFTILHFDKVHISNSMFRNNSAGGDSTHVPSGGAVHLAGSDVKFTNNTFKNNRALSGGAIQFHESNPRFKNNTFENNYARHSSGAIDAGTKSHPSFNGDKILNNISNHNGGGISFWDSTVASLDNVVISNNFSRDGGGVYLTSANASFKDCSIYNNKANGVGGGINSFNSNLNFQSCVFSHDTALVFGGGAGFYESEVDMDYCSFSDNISGVLGGGIYTDFSNIQISNSSFENDSSQSGGAIFTRYSQMNLNEDNFTNNSSKDNGGAIHSEHGSVDISNCSLSQNKSIWGGGILFIDIDSKMLNTEFISNQSEHGGGLNAGLSRVELNEVSFTENKSIWGGAMTITNSDLQVSDCNFQRNQADEAGAFEYIIDTMAAKEVCDVDITATTFLENNATGAVGTFRFIQLNSENSLVNINIDGCEFTNNSADRVNIAISSYIKDFKISNSILSGNNTIGRTSGCNFANNVTGKIENCLFNSNYTSGGSSATSVGFNSSVAFINCTFANNYGENGGALTLRNNSKILLLNSILWKNEPYNSVMAAVTDSTPCILDIYYSNIQYGVDSMLINDSISLINWETGNIEADPLFVDSLNNFSLMDNSPCIGAGIDSIVINDTWYYSPLYDIEGNPRPFPESSNPDIGVYEHNNVIPTDVREIEVITGKFEIAQNYPNPFNSSTRISYKIPHNLRHLTDDGVNSEWAKVKLFVYDVLGREVETLVNEKQRPGIYEVNWNAGKYSSGIYYYQIIVGEFVETKQMILLK